MTRKNQTSSNTSKEAHVTDILLHMPNFKHLVGKTQHSELLVEMIELAQGGHHLDVRHVVGKTSKRLAPEKRRQLFACVEAIGVDVQARLENVAERVEILSDNEGASAMKTFFNADDAQAAPQISKSQCRRSRALYLYLKQEQTRRAGLDCCRFDHAIEQSNILRQVSSEKHGSRFIGTKGVQPVVPDSAIEALKHRLAAQFPKIDVDDILIEQYALHDVSRDDRPITLFTLAATFNGKTIHYQQVAEGELKDFDTPAVSSVRYCWDAVRGELSVLCEDPDVRIELATAFRDVILGNEGDLQPMPILKFTLDEFRMPTVLEKLQHGRVDGVETIEIKHLVFVKPELRTISTRGRKAARKVSNQLVIKCDRFEDRDIYSVAEQQHRLSAFGDYLVRTVRLKMRLAETPFRRAHSATFNVDVENGLSDTRLTKDDSETVFAQLEHLNIASQH